MKTAGDFQVYLDFLFVWFFLCMRLFYLNFWLKISEQISVSLNFSACLSELYIRTEVIK